MPKWGWQRYVEQVRTAELAKRALRSAAAESARERRWCDMDRRRMLHAFKAAQEIGNYEEVPVLPAKVDPQLFMSRNSVHSLFT